MTSRARDPMEIVTQAPHAQRDEGAGALAPVIVRAAGPLRGRRRIRHRSRSIPPEPGTDRKHVAYDGGSQSTHIYRFDGDLARLRANLREEMVDQFWNLGVLAR